MHRMPAARCSPCRSLQRIRTWTRDAVAQRSPTVPTHNEKIRLQGAGWVRGKRSQLCSIEARLAPQQRREISGRECRPAGWRGSHQLAASCITNGLARTYGRSSAILTRRRSRTIRSTPMYCGQGSGHTGQESQESEWVLSLS